MAEELSDWLEAASQNPWLAPHLGFGVERLRDAARIVRAYEQAPQGVVSNSRSNGCPDVVCLPDNALPADSWGTRVRVVEVIE